MKKESIDVPEDRRADFTDDAAGTAETQTSCPAATGAQANGKPSHAGKSIEQAIVDAIDEFGAFIVVEQGPYRGMRATR